MILMALDHVRDYFFSFKVDPTDMATTTPSLFLTRWLTHFCAPLFVFLAGTSVFLQSARGRTPSELSWMLVLRGLWLIVLEFTVVNWAWAFNFHYDFVVGQVIWAIGVSMLVLACLVWFPSIVAGLFGIAMIVGHNALDGVVVAQGEPGFIPWTILHGGKAIPVGSDRVILPLYPLIPWIGVLAAGYAFGNVLVQSPERRRRLLQWTGLGLIAAFLILRSGNFYGEPMPWDRSLGADKAWMSFLNVSKYPPSLQYLLMTLGPGLLLLAWFDRIGERVSRVLLVFGRVPMFYYLTHLVVIHLLAAIAYSVTGATENARFIWSNDPFFNTPAGFGFPQPVFYVAWIATVALLYPACVWFGRLKAEHRGKAWTTFI